MNALITSFKIDIAQAVLDDLKNRLTQTRWPDELPDVGWKRGVPLQYLKQLAHYWANDFDWREHEEKLNSFPHFTTEIDGQVIHFMHIKSPEPNAIPLIIFHGWPGSFVEFINMIGPLTDPKAHGEQSDIAFDLVIPSIPGFGFSVPLKEPGWNLMRTATAMAELMNRLGYTRYGAQGEDLGAGITGMLTGIAPQSIIGTHVSTDILGAAGIGLIPKDVSTFSEAEQKRIEQLLEYEKDGTGYLKLQATRPQTLAYALSDSPVGQLAWIVEKFKEWTDSSKDLPEDAVDIDLLLTNVSLYWFNRLGASSAHIIYENMNTGFDWAAQNEENVQAQETTGAVPAGMAAFGSKEDTRLLKRLLEPLGKIDHWSEFERGCHFPAMEVPQLLVNDLQKFFSKIHIMEKSSV